MMLILNLLTISNLIWGEVTTAPQSFKKVYKEYGNWSLLVPGCFENEPSAPGYYCFTTSKCKKISFTNITIVSAPISIDKYKNYIEYVKHFYSRDAGFKKIDGAEYDSFAFLHSRQDSKHYSKKGLQYVSWEVRIECNGHEVEISVPFEAKASDATFERDNFKTTLTLFPEIEEIVKSFKCHKKAEPKK